MSHPKSIFPLMLYELIFSNHLKVKEKKTKAFPFSSFNKYPLPSDNKLIEETLTY